MHRCSSGLDLVTTGAQPFFLRACHPYLTQESNPKVLFTTKVLFYQLHKPFEQFVNLKERNPAPSIMQNCTIAKAHKHPKTVQTKSGRVRLILLIIHMDALNLFPLKFTEKLHAVSSCKDSFSKCKMALQWHISCKQWLFACLSNTKNIMSGFVTFWVLLHSPWSDGKLGDVMWGTFISSVTVTLS